jgi:hypothetical protein
VTLGDVYLALAIVLVASTVVIPGLATLAIRAYRRHQISGPIEPVDLTGLPRQSIPQARSRRRARFL